MLERITAWDSSVSHFTFSVNVVMAETESFTLRHVKIHNPIRQRQKTSYVLWKGIRNEKFGSKKTLLFERIFEVIKIGLYSSRVSHFSLEIFGFVWYVNNSTAYVTLHNDLLGNQEYHGGCTIKSLKTVHVCVRIH